MHTQLSYKEILETLFSRRPKKREGNLELIQEVLQEYSSPHLAYPTIHVGGTNGKGQVSTKIASALEEGGYKVGLFISPHILDYAERITINGVKISKEKVCQYYEEILDLMTARGWDLNFFDCTTLFGFRHFQEEKVDIAVIEVGLGGRFDATNVIHPLVSVITSISLEHTEYLGNTLGEIAFQKAGIIKANTPVVLGPTAQLKPILEEAKKNQAPVHTVNTVFSYYEKENRETARKALELLPFSLPEKAIAKGLEKNLPCRFERRGNVIYDVAHNPGGFRRLKEALSEHYPENTFRFLIGMGKEKDHQGSLKEIAPLATHIHFVKAKGNTSAETKDLADALKEVAQTPYTCEESIVLGMQNAKAQQMENELLVVTGSFYILLDALLS